MARPVGSTSPANNSDDPEQVLESLRKPVVDRRLEKKLESQRAAMKSLDSSSGPRATYDKLLKKTIARRKEDSARFAADWDARKAELEQQLFHEIENVQRLFEETRAKAWQLADVLRDGEEEGAGGGMEELQRAVEERAEVELKVKETLEELLRERGELDEGDDDEDEDEDGD